MKKAVEITIMGHKLQIRSDSEEPYIEKIAKYVDGKVKDVLSKTKSVASTQVAILVAMNIADELFRQKDKTIEKNEAISKRIETIIEHIDLRL